MARDRRPEVVPSLERRCGGLGTGAVIGHRILRRVLGGGRHLGSSRTICRHGRVVTAVSAASSRSASDDAKASKRRVTKVTRTERKRERRQGCQRLGRIQRRGKKTPTLAIPLRQRKEREARKCRSSTRQSGPGRCETPGPPVKPRGSQNPRGAHAAKVAE